LLLDLYFKSLYNQDYPKNKIHLYIRTNDNKDQTEQKLLTFIEKYSGEYASVYYNSESVSESLKKYSSHEWNTERFKVIAKLRQESIDYCIQKGLHYFISDCDNFISPNTISELFKLRTLGVIAPMLKIRKPDNTINIYNNENYSNYHYSVDNNGYYSSNPFYFNIIKHEIRGIFEVKVVHCTYFIHNRLQYLLKFPFIKKGQNSNLNYN
jgi:hypothetical protein